MPNYFKAIAIAGIAVNSLSLAIGYPLDFVNYFYGFFGEEPGASTYTIFDILNWVIGIPLAFVLLIASVALLNRKEWGRVVCVVGLAVSILWNFVWLFFSLAYELATPGGELATVLILAPIVLLIAAFEALTLIYLNRATVKGYMRGVNG